MAAQAAAEALMASLSATDSAEEVARVLQWLSPRLQRACLWLGSPLFGAPPLSPPRQAHAQTTALGVGTQDIRAAAQKKRARSEKERNHRQPHGSHHPSRALSLFTFATAGLERAEDAGAESSSDSDGGGSAGHPIAAHDGTPADSSPPFSCRRRRPRCLLPTVFPSQTLGCSSCRRCGSTSGGSCRLQGWRPERRRPGPRRVPQR